MGNIEVINIGAVANDGSGDPLRVAFEKVNNNFARLAFSNFNTLQAITIGNTPGQLIFTVPTTQFTQGYFQINSSNQSNQDSQNITINASIKNDKTDVSWVGHSTIFVGNAITRYSMNVSDGNVNLYADPIANAQLVHWISYQVTDNPLIPGSFMILNQDINDTLGTEALQTLTTEN